MYACALLPDGWGAAIPVEASSNRTAANTLMNRKNRLPHNRLHKIAITFALSIFDLVGCLAESLYLKNSVICGAASAPFGIVGTASAFMLKERRLR